MATSRRRAAASARATAAAATAVAVPSTALGADHHPWRMLRASPIHATTSVVVGGAPCRRPTDAAAMKGMAMFAGAASPAGRGPRPPCAQPSPPGTRRARAAAATFAITVGAAGCVLHGSSAARDAKPTTSSVDRTRSLFGAATPAKQAATRTDTVSARTGSFRSASSIAGATAVSSTAADHRAATRGAAGGSSTAQGSAWAEVGATAMFRRGRRPRRLRSPSRRAR